ncbi:MAG: hypothetical protein KAU21_10190 [Gammaproteobacteria bacterium]|nr:hypothetical protein [Gammaproteobacteria bacterium]
MSDISKKHAGIVQSIVKEFETHRFPRLLRLKEKVDGGDAINDVDLDFLCKVIEDANRTMHMTANHPELHEFCQHVVHLYHEISAKALENEKKGY